MTLQGLTFTERQAWRAVTAAALAWCDAPSEVHAKQMRAAGRAAFKTPIPLPREIDRMRAFRAFLGACEMPPEPEAMRQMATMVADAINPEPAPGPQAETQPPYWLEG